MTHVSTCNDTRRGARGVLPALLLAAAACAAGCVMMSSATAATSVHAMRWQRRVILMTAPSAADADLLAQNRILAAWQGAGERDVSLVEIAADAVIGASDSARQLRDAYALHGDRFEVVLIGKDGGVKLRSAHPVSADTLTQTIDAMPMRRSGER